MYFQISVFRISRVECIYSQSDHEPRLNVVNQTLIQLSLIQWWGSHDITFVDSDHSMGCSGRKEMTKAIVL